MTESLKDFNEALRINPLHDKAYYSRGNWKLNQGYKKMNNIIFNNFDN